MVLRNNKSQAKQNKNQQQLDTLIFINHLSMLSGNQNHHIYTQASIEKIQKVVKQFSIVDEQGNQFTLFDNIQKFKKFSPGIYLLFRLIKHVIIMFSVISIISIIQLILLLQSPYYKGFQNIIRINLLRVTIASLQPQHYNIYIGLDFAIVLIVSGFLIWFSEQIRYFAQKCNQNNKLPSYLTVQLRYIPQNFSQIGLLKQLENVYGIYPNEIYVGRDYGRFIKHYSKLTQTAINFRVCQELFLHQQTEEGKKKQAYKLINQFIKVKQMYFGIKSRQFNEREYLTKQVFIVLQNYADRQKLLKNQDNYLMYLFNRFIKRQQSFVFRACQIQPQTIIWENIGISNINYYIRCFIVLVLLCLSTCVGIIIIFMLEVLETASIGDAYYFHQQYMGTIKPQTPQQNYNYDSGKLTLLILLTPITVFISKKIIMALLSHTMYFRKYPNQVSKIKSQTLTLTFFYFFVVAVLHLILYLKSTYHSTYVSVYDMLYPITAKLFKIAHYNPSSIHMYQDFSLDWYKQATFFIIVISSTSFNVANAVKFFIGYTSFYLQKISALKQKNIYSVHKKLHGVNIHLQNIYASMHAIVLFALLYGCPIPITIIFSLFNLVFLFYTVKWTFIKYGQKPLRMGHSLSRISINILLTGVIIHCIMAPIFLGASGIGQQNSHHFWTLIHPNNHLVQNSLTIRQRYNKFGPLYLTLGIGLIIYMVCRKLFLFHVLKKIKEFIKNIKGNDEEVTQLSNGGKQHQFFGLYPSYSMHYNKKYSQILRNVQMLNKSQAKRPKFMPVQIFEDSSNCERCSTRKQRVFDLILSANRKYLDKQKNQTMYNKVQQIAKTIGYDENKIFYQSQKNQPSAQRTINNNFQNINPIDDAIVENQN